MRPSSEAAWKPARTVIRLRPVSSANCRSLGSRLPLGYRPLTTPSRIRFLTRSTAGSPVVTPSLYQLEKYPIAGNSQHEWLRRSGIGRRMTNWLGLA
jgi:hypothetical protein